MQFNEWMDVCASVCIYIGQIHCTIQAIVFQINWPSFCFFSRSIPGYLSTAKKNSIDLTSPMISFCDLNFLSPFFCHQHTHTAYTHVSINNARNQKLSHFSLRTKCEGANRRHNEFQARIEFAHYMLKMETNYIYVTLIIISISVFLGRLYHHL